MKGPSNQTAKKTESDPVWILVKGSVEIGVIEPEAAAVMLMPSGAIRLAEGFAGKKGYGLRHIQDNLNRVATFKGLGFETTSECIAEIAANWQTAEAAKEGNRLVLVWPLKGHHLRLIVQLFQGPKGYCWSVVTAIPGRAGKAEDILYRRGEG